MLVYEVSFVTLDCIIHDLSKMKGPELMRKCRNVQVYYLNAPVHRLFIKNIYSKLKVIHLNYIKWLVKVLNIDENYFSVIVLSLYTECACAKCYFRFYGNVILLKCLYMSVLPFNKLSNRIIIYITTIKTVDV
jgi:hypothetical protein